MKFSWLRGTFPKLILFIALLLAASSVGFYFLELRPRGHTDFLSALWWTVVTLTTVGYGDIVPASTPGRILGLVVMVCGIGLVSTLTGNLASLLVERHAKKRKGLLQVKLSGHVIILGWNSYAPNLIRTLAQTEVLAKSDLVVVNNLPQDERDALAFKLDMGERLQFVYGSPAQESVLHRASPERAKVVYMLSQDGLEPKDADQQNLYAALTVRSLAPKVLIYSEVLLAENREHLLRAGVNEIISRGEVTSLILGMMGANPSAWPFFQGLIGVQGQGCLGVRPLTQEEKHMAWGEFFQALWTRTGAMPLALCHESKELSLEDMLDEGSALDRFILELFTASGQQTQLGKQGPRILINPAADQKLDMYDGVLFLKPARKES